MVPSYLVLRLKPPYEAIRASIHVHVYSICQLDVGARGYQMKIDVAKMSWLNGKPIGFKTGISMTLYM